jgi:hypothetical protein
MPLPPGGKIDHVTGFLDEQSTQNWLMTEHCAHWLKVRGYNAAHISSMPKNKPATGPMTTQPIGRPSILPTQLQPTRPTARVDKTPQPKQNPTRAEAVRAAKAEITRRESLRKQRLAMKA